MKAIVELHYLPCIRYISKFYTYEQIIIDDREHFGKQSYRNRGTIAGANGKIDLIIPVHNSRRAVPAQELRIDNHRPWQRQHWQSIRSAYGKTPFFEHYAHKFEDIYLKPADTLFNFNWELLLKILEILRIEKKKMVLFSETTSSEVNIDLRNTIHPKERYNTVDGDFKSVHYFQAFEEKNGFMPNLSIIDLIFNIGPDAVHVLNS